VGHRLRRPTIVIHCLNRLALQGEQPMRPIQTTSPNRKKTMDDVKKFLRLPAVIDATGRRRSSIYSGIKEGTFPAPINIGPRAVAWEASAIEQWQKKQIEASRPTRATAPAEPNDPDEQR
jgi:prophage regulatory protein